MKFLLSVLLILQSISFTAFADNKGLKQVKLKDLIISYNYELETKSIDSEKAKSIKELYENKLKTYIQENGSETYRVELISFLKSLPTSDETSKLLNFLKSPNLSKDQLMKTLEELQGISQVMAGESANWSIDWWIDVTNPWVVLGAVAATAFVTYMIAYKEDPVVTEENFGSGNDNTGSADGTKRITLRFSGSDSVTFQIPPHGEDGYAETFYCSDYQFNTYWIESNAEDEARRKCRIDPRVIEEGLTNKCDGYTSASVSGSATSNPTTSQTLYCSASSSITITYTIGD